MEHDASSNPTFRQLVFSGGGTRCFWQGGFLEIVSEPLNLDPQRVTGVSGGALSAACHIAGQGRRLLDVMGSAFAEQDYNFNEEPLENDGGATPHQELYRSVVEETMTAKAVSDIANGPAFQISLALPPANLPLKAGAFLALILYELDQHTRSTPHMSLPVAIGARKLMVDAREAARTGKLTDLVCAAAVIPPIFDLPEWNGQRVMDAGTVDNAPMPDPDEGRTLILLTRQYRNTPDNHDRIYAHPSRETPADKIDFTDREKIERTWKTGRKDGKKFLKAHEFRGQKA